LSEKAMALSFELNHWVYDCIYLACALDLGLPLLTADRKFWNAAKRASYGDVVELLTWEGQTD
jgi:predicted nucleic acid-binding protein